MSVLQALDGLAVVVAVALLGLAVLVTRRRLITRRGGTFDCSLRLHEGAHGKGWALGIGRYSGDALEWYRVFSYSTRPKRVVGRRRLQVVERRQPRGPEAFSLQAGAVIVRCHDGTRPVEFAMSPDALTGFLSWAESSPPGMPVP